MLNINAIDALFDHSEEYPQNVAERGLEQNHIYHYISSSFLDGLVNYAGIKWGCMIERYGSSDPAKHTEFIVREKFNYTEESMREVISKVDSSIHLKLRDLPDNSVLLGETVNSYWFFYFDWDCSDCSIGRLEKSRFASFEEFKYAIINNVEGKYWELSNSFNGWITSF
jgi:hypothetical protein